MPKVIDETGKTFGKLYVVGRTGAANGSLFVCKCSCGTFVEEIGDRLRSGSATACVKCGPTLAVAGQDVARQRVRRP